ncbi:MAG TPA: hypothetical protein VE778_03565 [Candidatus Bathyarchaeia archaeon]|jgi:hypothetical protein|nr:hypothetical protein [Candidatus Bathyarchaeia archaeon]
MNAEAAFALIFGVLFISVFNLFAFTAINKRVDAVLGRVWNVAPVKRVRKVGWRICLFLFLTTLFLTFVEAYRDVWPAQVVGSLLVVFALAVLPGWLIDKWLLFRAKRTLKKSSPSSAEWDRKHGAPPGASAD